MPRAASARRYAQAAFQIALEAGELDAWLADLTLAADALRNEEFVGVLDAPQVPLDRKVAVITEALGDSVAPLVLNLVSLLASRHIAYLLGEVVEQYQALLDAHQGIERAEAVSAVPLEPQQRQMLEELLKGLAGKDVRLTSRVDPQILGGLVARVGDRVLDGSSRTRLQAMRRDLAERRA